MYLDKAQYFFTPEGPCSFRHFREGETVTVLNEKGNWSKGTVRTFGRKPLHPILLHDQDTEEYEIRAGETARWLLQPRGKFVCRNNKQTHRYQDVISFGLQVGDCPLSIEARIFSGDEQTFILKNKNFIVHEVLSESYSGDAWGISLKEGRFYVLAENILFGSCQ